MNETIVKKQYNLLNALKIIAAFFVVAIHIHFPGDFGNAIIYIARFAVPFFFMVSGFFSYYSKKTVLNEKYKRKVKHILALFLGGTGIYIVFNVASAMVGGNVFSYFRNIFSVKSIVEFLLFNQTSVSEFLWFLPALLYTYAIFFVFEKSGITKKMYFLIPVLFLCGVLLRELPDVLNTPPEILKNGYLYRNFAFIGLPFFMLGHYIRVNEEKLKNKLSNIFLIVMMFIGTVAAVAAGFLHIQKSVYVGTFFAVFALFVFAVKNEENINVPHLASAGAKYSFYIYVLHIMIRNIVRKCGEIIPFAGSIIEKLEPVMPIVIFILSLIASMVYVYLKKLLKEKSKTQIK